MQTKPTKEQLQKYLKQNKREHTYYSASVHFGIDITEVYRILDSREDSGGSLFNE